MQKLALDIDPSVVGRYAAGGALVGGGASALVNLVHMLNQMRMERAKKLQPTETDENTIVLTLPKRAEAVSQDIVAPDRIEGPDSGIYSINRGQKQSREHGTNKFGPKLCQEKQAEGSTGWPTLTAAVLAALGGGVAGSAVVNKLYEKQRERRLQSDLDSAKQEYMDLLAGHSTKAASLEEIFTFGFPFEKEAGSTFGMLNYPLAAMAILTVLGAGTTGYLTKKILDEKFQDTQASSLDVPKVKRIVFKSTPGEEPETDQSKMASADDLKAVAAGLLVMMDKIGGTTRFVGATVVKEAMDKAGVTVDQLIKEADDFDTLSTRFMSPDNAALRESFYNLFNRYMTKNPISRFFRGAMLKTPVGRGMADRKFLAALKGIQGGVPMMNGRLAPTSKVAQDVGAVTSMSPMSAIGTSLLGSSAAKELTNKNVTPQELAQLIMAAQESTKQQQLLKHVKEPGKIDIVAKGKGAQQYLAAHQAKIQAIVRRLAAEGQI